VRHTPAGTQIHVSVRDDADGVTVAVDDRGPGVPAHQHDAIFQIFRRGDHADARPGTGVGLALVAQFAELHGGRAFVADNPGGGASFRVFLPKNHS
jgi:signal transduction histidine kinase